MQVGTVTVRRLEAGDIPDADAVMRTAFGTHLGVPEPGSFGGDAEFVRTRSRAEHTAAFVAESDGRLLGSSFVARWGSFGLFGPLTVDPSAWDSGIGSRLMAPVTAELDGWGVSLAGLFTFPDSAKHIGLYHKYGFFPRYLTALMQRTPFSDARTAAGLRLSAAPPDERAGLLGGISATAAAVYDGLDLTAEIGELTRQGLGETVIVEDEAGVAGFAVCHLGAGSEAGSGVCYVKFAAVRPGPGAAAQFTRLLGACEALAAESGAGTVLAGVNTAREHAYEAMLGRGYRAGMYGLAMHRPNQPGFSRRDVFVLDDWR